ncbi:MAG: hypothetical protein KBC15_04300 [Candidatus Levybacteria bacterium]|nr:hypothetical protein [Candidatus Levybacteria bacterium]
MVCLLLASENSVKHGHKTHAHPMLLLSRTFVFEFFDIVSKSPNASLIFDEKQGATLSRVEAAAVCGTDDQVFLVHHRA